MSHVSELIVSALRWEWGCGDRLIREPATLNREGQMPPSVRDQSSLSHPTLDKVGFVLFCFERESLKKGRKDIVYF